MLEKYKDSEISRNRTPRPPDRLNKNKIQKLPILKTKPENKQFSSTQQSQAGVDD